MAKQKANGHPKLSELKSGPYPSFVKEIESAAEKNAMAQDLLGQLELSYNERLGHWKHGGIVGVMGYGGGVIGRYSDVPEKFPNVSHFHTVRVNMPAGWFYKSGALRKVCDIWEKHGSGILNMHGSTGDLVLLGCRTEVIEPVFAELTAAGFDLGGSGSVLRTPSCCNGKARCEWACYDTMNLAYNLTMHFQDELHRPFFPYKFKFKFAGCPNDCVASIARADMSFIGMWKDDIQVNQDRVLQYAKEGVNIQRDVVGRCPTSCMEWDGKQLNIDNENCTHCMHCINVLHHALRPGKERGCAVLIGAKAPILEGAQLSSVLIPFWEPEEPYDDIKEVINAIWEVWGEEGKNRERIGEFIQRVGLANFCDSIGLEPVPEMVAHPRENPYVFYRLDKEEE